MKRYAPHPLAQMVPPMTQDEFRDLKADIKANGLEQPITLYEEKILDGIHRERACFELGISVETRDWRKRNGQTPVQYVLSMNGHRRHLSPGQKAALAVELANQMRDLYPSSAGGGGDASEIAVALGCLEVPDDSHPVLTMACQAVGAAFATAKEVATLKTDSPKIYIKVRDGEMTVAQATRERRSDEPKRRRSAEEINAALIRSAIVQAKALDATMSQLALRDVILADTNLLFVWGHLFSAAATLKVVAKSPELPETRSGALKLLARARND